MKIVYDTETREFTADGVDIPSIDISMHDRYVLNDRLFALQTIVKYCVKE